jgi:hypothetical protein
MRTDLSAFELDALHWDERGHAITASFEGPLDEVGRQSWDAPPEHDWYRLHFRFAAVSDLQVRGWSYLPARVEQTPVGDRVSVVVTGEGTDFQFTSAPAVLVGRRTSKAGPP